jgi:hypothetical protein
MRSAASADAPGSAASAASPAEQEAFHSAQEAAAAQWRHIYWHRAKRRFRVSTKALGHLGYCVSLDAAKTLAMTQLQVPDEEQLRRRPEGAPSPSPRSPASPPPQAPAAPEAAAPAPATPPRRLAPAEEPGGGKAAEDSQEGTEPGELQRRLLRFRELAAIYEGLLPADLEDMIRRRQSHLSARSSVPLQHCQNFCPPLALGLALRCLLVTGAV